MVMFMRWLPLLIMGAVRSGQSHRHHNNNRLMELLTAGIVAKVLQKQEGDGGGGHHEYYPVPIHLPVHGHHHHHEGAASNHHSHTVTEKIIPIPIPHHTTRIIHINADALPKRGHRDHGGHGGEEFDLGGGGGDGGGSYGSNSGSFENNAEMQPHHHSRSQSKIKQIVFQDHSVFGPMPAQMAPVRHQTYMAYRRPALGMVQAAAGHPAYLVRPRYPMVAIRQRVPQMPAPYAAASMYAMPYRRAPVPSPAYMNPMLMRRPYPAPMAMPAMPAMPAMW
ncbi:uncharacterized protein CDAR_122941 [Caerostris darwini]|uniref:Uncharacterized protein n=1 Tax=Caerostris darwini TaxID=1538125 RepID=A0AAV4NZL0_9ARAC|nr:uncharacterized protein CDAR_122941 [Caerostris darwini]